MPYLSEDRMIFDADATVNLYGVIPESQQVACIVHSETPHGKTYIKLEWEILEGPYKGRKLWDYLNLFHENVAAVNIARRDLGNIMKACGKPQATQSEELHNISIIISVTVQEPTANFSEYSNKITAYYALKANAQQSASEQAATRANGAGQPWSAQKNDNSQPGNDDIPF